MGVARGAFSKFAGVGYSLVRGFAVRPQQGNFLFLIHLPHTISPQPPLKNTIQIVLNIFALIFFLRLGKNTKAHWYRKKDEKKDENTEVCSSEHRNIFQGRILLFPCRTDTVTYMAD